MSDHKGSGVPLAALWLNETKAGVKYYSGRLGDARLCAWIVTDKKHDRAPDLKLVLYPASKEKTATRKPSHDEDMPY